MYCVLCTVYCVLCTPDRKHKFALCLIIKLELDYFQVPNVPFYITVTQNWLKNVLKGVPST